MIKVNKKKSCDSQ